MSATDTDPSTATRPRGFVTVGVTLALFFFATAAPSALYALYAQRWGFSAATLTAVFAVYALALLVALLTTGSLSDVVGRRPVLLIAIAGEVVALVLFAAADGVAWLFAARAVQGLATGLATSALSAALLDLEPPERPGSASLLGTGGPTSGQALGALGAGVLVQFVPAPTVVVYVVMLAAFLACGTAIWLLPEPTTPQRHRLRAVLFLPRVGLPPVARPAFLTALPCLIAVWALAGLHLSLGPSLALGLLGREDRLLSALVVTLLTGCGAVAAITARTRAPRPVLVAGCLCLLVGMAATLVALEAGSIAGFYAGTVVAGLGFGLGLLATVTLVMTAAPPAERGRVAAAMFVVAYLSFGLPAVAAGTATGTFGLRAVAVVYGLGVGVLALVALVATLVARRRPAGPEAPVLVLVDGASDSAEALALVDAAARFLPGPAVIASVGEPASVLFSRHDPVRAVVVDRTRSGHGWATLGVPVLVLPPGPGTAGAEATDGGRLCGRVRDRDGAAVDAVLTVVDAAGRQVALGRSDAAGGFDLDPGDASGRGLLVVRRQDGTGAPVVIPIGLGAPVTCDVVADPGGLDEVVPSTARP